jgi:hypothetical protein
MPQAPQWLRDKFPGDDSEALDVLEDNFTIDKGMIRPKVQGYLHTQREADAISYLVHEWDYAYDPVPRN